MWWYRLPARPGTCAKTNGSTSPTGRGPCKTSPWKETGREGDLLLILEQAAERLGTTAPFPRRLIAERGTAFVKVGRHVRTAKSALDAMRLRCG
ncbi:hypothetical protein CGZ69_18765 [Streptomyces peucetius subsp. caesius ATCC 27952]|nr:hypothetical protein CGZ69_18765 [Streptomyces peucetius subsp. caesius ATCC 27952]